jgi:hypothetical protein
MVITKIDLKELSQTINYLVNQLSMRPTASIDYHDWLFVVGKIRNSYNGRVIVNYHIVARNKVKYRCVEKLVETHKEIKEFLTTVVIIEAEEGS